MEQGVPSGLFRLPVWGSFLCGRAGMVSWSLVLRVFEGFSLRKTDRDLSETGRGVGDHHSLTVRVGRSGWGKGPGRMVKALGSE